ncbi:MAG: hypothetical protein ACFFCS_14915 [Candidatus Hodarchaeota archaeon]
MYFLVIKMYPPPTKLQEHAKVVEGVAKTFDVNKYGEGIVEQVIGGISKTTEAGPETLAIFKVKEGKLEDAMNLAIEYHGKISIGCEGYKVKIEPYVANTKIGELLGLPPAQ